VVLQVMVEQEMRGIPEMLEPEETVVPPATLGGMAATPTPALAVPAALLVAKLELHGQEAAVAALAVLVAVMAVMAEMLLPSVLKEEVVEAAEVLNQEVHLPDQEIQETLEPETQEIRDQQGLQAHHQEFPLHHKHLIQLVLDNREPDL